MHVLERDVDEMLIDADDAAAFRLKHVRLAPEPVHSFFGPSGTPLRRCALLPPDPLRGHASRRFDSVTLGAAVCHQGNAPQRVCDLEEVGPGS